MLACALTACGGGGGGGGGGVSSFSGGGSGSGGSDGGGTPSPGQPRGDIIVRFDLQARSTVPSSVTHLRFTGFSASGSVLYGPQTFPKAPVITLTGVPVQVVSLQIDYLSNGVVSGMGTHPVDLTTAATQTIDNPDEHAVSDVLKSVTVTPPAPSVAFGTFVQFTATGELQDGSTRDLTLLASWSSSRSTVASVSSVGLARAIASGKTTITADFGGMSASSQMTVTGSVLESIQVTPASASIAKGTIRQYVAIGLFNDGSTQDLTGQVLWTSTPAGVASLSTGGLATGVGVGTCTVNASISGVTGSASLQVTSALLQSIDVTPVSSSLPKGLTRQLTATGTFSDASTQDLSTLVTWTTAPGGIATVDAAGLATGVAVGTTVVRASLDGVSGSATLQVTDAVPVSVAITPALPSLPKGTTRQLNATATFSDGSSLDVTTQASWTSSNTGIATVSTTGVATASTIGTSTITATLLGVSGTTDLTVSAATLRSVQVTPPGSTIPVGTTVQLTAIGTFSDNTTADITGDVAWTASPQVNATVSADGLVTGVVDGETIVSATLPGVASGFAEVDITPVLLESIQVTPALPAIPQGTTVQLTAIGTYSDNTTRDVTDLASWSSNPAGVASIDPNGLATGTGVGTTTCRAALDGILGTATLTVTAAELQSIQVTPATNPMAKGTTVQLTATGTFSDSTTRDLTGQVAWTTSPTGVATVSTSGVASAVAEGSTTVTATLGGIQGTASIAVSAAVLQSIQITPSKATIKVSTTQQLTATGVFSDLTTQDLTSLVSWTTSPTGVATVSSSGLATGVAAGTTTVTATRGGVTGTATLTVTDATLQSIQITPANSSVPLGATKQMTATGLYSDNSTQDLTSQVSWTTSPTGIATVDIGGLATGVGEGTTSVTATLGGVSSSSNLIVTSAVLQSIQVTPVTPTIPRGATAQLTAIGTFSDGSTQNLTSQVSWTTSPTGIATVSASGLATGVAEGSTTVAAAMSGVSSTGRTLTVTAAALTSISITPSAPTIALGTSRQLTATGTFSDGTTQNLTAQASWTTQNASVATVNPTGLVSAAAAGTSGITATFNSISGSTTVTVVSATLQSIQVTPAAAPIPKGTTGQLTAIGTFSDASTQDISDQVSWSTSPTGIATISSTGLATGVGVGTTIATATLNGKSGSASVTVTTATLTSISVTPSNPSLAKGSTKQLTATGTFSDNTTKNVTSQVSWTTADGTIVAVNQGLVTAVETGGPVNVTATLNAVSGSTGVTVTAAALKSIQITPANATLPKGTTLQLTATGVFTDNSTQDLTTTVSWTTSPTGLSERVSIDANGLATASTTNLGNATVTATSGPISGSTGIAVTAAVLQSIDVTPASPTVAVGLTALLKATGTYSDGTTQDITRQVSWTTSPTGFATVDSGGRVVGVAVGSTTVTATKGLLSDTAAVTVADVALVGIRIQSPESSIANGTGVQLTAIGLFSDHQVRDISADVSWTTSPTGVVAVNGTGFASGVATGTTTVTASMPGVSGSTSLTATSATLQSLALAPTNSKMGVGTTVQFTAIGTFSDNSTQDLTTQVSWTSDSTSFATISSTGRASRVSNGTALLTATRGAVSQSTNLTVTSATLSSIVVTPASPTVVGGNTLQLTATGTFDDSSTQDLTDQVTWSSSNTARAIVNSTGLLLAQSGGTTDVTATLSTVSGSTTVTVTDPPGAVWTLRDSGTLESLLDVTFGASKFVAVGFPAGTNGTIRTSSDGVTWAGATAGTDKLLTSATFGSSTFVVTGIGGTILTSTNGTDWTGRTSGTTNNLNGAVFGSSTFVAVGNAGTILTSSDATTWSTATSGTTSKLNGVGFGNSLFVAVGESGTILTSADGSSWTSRTTGTTSNLFNVTFGNGTFVAVGDGGTVLTSSDGQSWTTRNSGTSVLLRDAVFGESSFVAVGDLGTILTSADGVNWIPRPTGTDRILLGVTHNGSTFVTVGAAPTGNNAVVFTAP